MLLYPVKPFSIIVYAKRLQADSDFGPLRTANALLALMKN